MLWIGPVKRWLQKWWGAIVAVVVAVLGALLLRRRSRPSVASPRELERAASIVRDAVRSEAEIGEKARAEARKAAEEAEWLRKRANAESESLRSMEAHEREAAVRRIKERLRKHRNGSGIVILLGALSGIPGPVKAAEPVTGATHEDGSSLAAGWWMDDAEHAETAAWLAELDGLRSAADQWQRSAEQYEQAAHHDAVALTLAMTVQQSTERALKICDAEVESQRKWYRKPGFLVATGIVIGGFVVGIVPLVAR